MDETKEIEEQRNLQTGKVADILDACISHDNEAEWFEFKANLCKPDEIGEYLGNKTKVTPSETHTETHIETHTETSTSSHLHALNDTMKRILEYCSSPRSGREILEHLGMKDKNNLMLQIKKLLDQGRLARTVPNNPKNRNQRYVTIR